MSDTYKYKDNKDNQANNDKEKEKKSITDYTEDANAVIKKIKEVFNNLTYILADKRYGVGESSFQNPTLTEDETAGARSLVDTLRTMEEDYITRKTGLSFPDPEEVLPESLGGKLLSYNGKSEEALGKEAEAALAADYADKRNSAEEKYLTKLNDLDAKISALGAEEEAKKSAIDTAADKARRAYTDDMIKQGLVNSTIMSYGNALIDDMQSEAYEKYDKELDLKYNEIRAKIEEADLAYRNALNEYDLKHAADLEAKIAKLKTAEEARLKAINEYNRKLAEREATYQQKRARKIADMQKTRINAIIDAALAEREEEERSGYISPEKQSEYLKRLEAAKEFYSSYDPKVANTMILLTENELVPLLGTSANYLSLLTWNGSRGTV